MSTPLKAHGMDGSLVEPDWPPISRDEVADVLARFSCSGDVRIVSVSPRPFSAACVAQVGDRRVFLKRHARAVRNAASLNQEHRFIQWLRSHGASVPAVLPTTSGDTAYEAPDWTYELHEAAEGEDLYADAISWTPFFRIGHAFAAGEALARLHLAAQGYEAPQRMGTTLIAAFTIYAADDPAASMAKYIEDRPALQDFVREQGWMEEAFELLTPFALELRPHLPLLPALWTHNDWHPSNLFWNAAGPNARVTAAIDFGLCDRTNAVHDLAHAIERSVVGWLDLVNDPAHPEGVPVQMDHLWAMLDGYERVRPLSRAEALALAPMLAVCHAEFALSEAEYYLTALASPEKAAYACPRYLLEHAQFWRGAGEPILHIIRDWAEARTR